MLKECRYYNDYFECGIGFCHLHEPNLRIWFFGMWSYPTEIAEMLKHVLSFRLMEARNLEAWLFNIIVEDFAFATTQL